MTAKLPRYALKPICNCFSSGTTGRGHRIRAFHARNPSYLRNRSGTDVTLGATAVAIFYRPDTFADLRSAASNAVAKSYASCFRIKEIMTRTLLTVFEAIDRFPISPSRYLFDLDSGRAHNHRPMDQTVALTRTRVAGADKLSGRFDHLDNVGRIDSNKQQFAKG